MRSCLFPISPFFSFSSLSTNIVLIFSILLITSLSLFQSHSYFYSFYHSYTKALLVLEITNTIEDNKMSKKDISTLDSTLLLPIIEVP